MESIEDPRKVSVVLAREQSLVTGKIEEKGGQGGGWRYLGRHKQLKTANQEEPPTEKLTAENHLIDVVV